MKNNNVVLYGDGVFSDGNAHKEYEAIVNSGFTSIILWTIHPHEQGDLYYNNDPIVKEGVFQVEKFGQVSKIIQDLKAAGKVKQVLCCIGSWGVADFANIKKMMDDGQEQALFNNFQVLIDNLKIDGFDFDLEESPYEFYKDVVVNLTLAFGRMGKFSTYCPYMDSDFWINCLEDVYKRNNSQQLVRWWNLQCYAGGGGNDPKAWVELIRKKQQSLGISDPDAFIIPGYGSSEKSPADIQREFSNIKKHWPGIDGGFIWNYGDIVKRNDGTTPKDYADAIIHGLGSK